MNIFYLHPNPYIAARLQYNKHVVKMVLESAQMLCTAHHVYGSDKQKEYVPYKQAHLNHPSTVWARRSKATYMWLFKHMMGLGYEYWLRYNKQHLSISKCSMFLSKPPVHIQGEEFVQPPQAMPDEYKDPCSIQAYWNYYIGEKHVVANLKTEKLYDKRPQETY